MDPISHSRAAQVAYQDLLRMHLDEAASEIIGSIEERRRNGRTYLYDRFRIASSLGRMSGTKDLLHGLA